MLPRLLHALQDIDAPGVKLRYRGHETPNLAIFRAKTEISTIFKTSLIRCIIPGRILSKYKEISNPGKTLGPFKAVGRS